MIASPLLRKIYTHVYVAQYYIPGLQFAEESGCLSRYKDGPRTGRSDYDSWQSKSFLHNIQTGCGAHPTSYPVGTGGDFPWVKAARGVKLPSV
jgi:hypothetical protein